MIYNADKADEAQQWLAKNKWVTNESGLHHLQYGRMTFTIKGFYYCCGAEEMGGFAITDDTFLNQYKEAFKKFCECRQRGFIMATLKNSQNNIREILVNAGFKVMEDLKFYNKNSTNEIEVLSLTVTS